MKKIFLVLLVCIAVVGCNKSDKDIIVCGDYEVKMTFAQDGDEMLAVINGDEVTLKLSPSASGARYIGVLNDTSVTLWSKGHDWTMFLNDEDAILCK